MSILKDFNPKNIKRNWNVVRSNPYANLKFQLWVVTGVLILTIIFICYTIIKVIINYDASGGGSIMAMVTKSILFVVMVIIVLKAWSIRTPLKNALKHYEENPVVQKGQSKTIDVRSEVDEILENIEKNKNNKIKLKNGENHVKKTV